MQDLQNNIPFLITLNLSAIFLLFFIGQTMRVRRLKKQNAEAGKSFHKRLAQIAEDNSDLQSEVVRLNSSNKNLIQGAEYNFKRAEEAEEARQKSAEAAAREVTKLKTDINAWKAKRHNLHEAINLYRDEVHHLGMLKDIAETRAANLHQILMKVYKPYHFMHADNEKISKHLQSLQPKRKSRAKGVSKA